MSPITLVLLAVAGVVGYEVYKTKGTGLAGGPSIGGWHAGPTQARFLNAGAYGVAGTLSQYHPHAGSAFRMNNGNAYFRPFAVNDLPPASSLGWV
jgi:hypothetical protein